MRTLFTLPGKLGDNICKLPIVYQYTKQHNRQAELCFNEGSESLLPLASLIPGVTSVFTHPGVNHYGMGGQPYDFGRPALFGDYEEVYHLGYKSFPRFHMTLSSVNDTPIDPTNILTEPCFNPPKDVRYLSIHLESSDKTTNDCTKEFVLPIVNRIRPYFEKFYIISHQHGNDYLFEGFPDYEIWNDGGDFIKTSRLLQESLYIGVHGCIMCLAGVQNIPAITCVGGWPVVPHFRPGVSYYGKDHVLDYRNVPAGIEIAERYLPK